MHECTQPTVTLDTDATRASISFPTGKDHFGFEVAACPMVSMNEFIHSFMDTESTIWFRPVSQSTPQWIEYMQSKPGHFPTQEGGSIVAKTSNDRCCDVACFLSVMPLKNLCLLKEPFATRELLMPINWNHRMLHRQHVTAGT